MSSTHEMSFVTRKRWWDFIAALFLLAAVFSSATRLAATHWVPHMIIIQTLTVLGYIIGLALGQSMFSPRWVWFLGIAYGLVAIPWQFGVNLYEATRWEERLISLSNRLISSLHLLIQKQPVEDPVFFLLFNGILFWALSTHAGYSLTRHCDPWRATILPGIAALVYQLFDPYPQIRAWLLAVFIFFTLLLLSRISIIKKLIKWRERHAHLPPYLGFDFIRATAAASALIIIFAWTVPSLAAALPPAKQLWQRMTDPVKEQLVGFSDAFAALRRSFHIVYDYYGDELPLGRGNLLSNEPVLMVEAPQRPIEGVKYYWRARVFDLYEKGVWSSSLLEIQDISPNQPFDLLYPSYAGRWEANFRITAQQSYSTLFYPGQPLWVSRPAQVKFDYNPDGTIDIGVIIAQPPLRPGDMYETKASLSAPTVAQLRSAGKEYPPWILERYLQLPANITPRTHALAHQIAEGYDNPYDIVEAITSYLRLHIQYNETLPSIPLNREPIDWMLFDLQQGFCNYYASAEVILLRILGIPARIAVGYAQGERSPENDVYIVRQRDAHAWPEVYFPNFGWVEFEPTVSQNPIQRPVGETFPEGILGGTTSEGQTPGEWRDKNRRDMLLEAERELLPEPLPVTSKPDFSLVTLPWLGLLASALSVILLVIFIHKPSPRTFLPKVFYKTFDLVGSQPPLTVQRWLNKLQLTPLERAYCEVNHALTRLREPPSSTATPAERAKQLNQLLPQAKDAINHLLTAYQTTVYGQCSETTTNVRHAAQKIMWSSVLARLQRLIAPFQEPNNKAIRLHKMD
ncbi:MAG: transglutaminase domain-containing protein [Chloroflexota bacterium]